MKRESVTTPVLEIPCNLFTQSSMILQFLVPTVLLRRFGLMKIVKIRLTSFVMFIDVS